MQKRSEQKENNNIEPKKNKGKKITVLVVSAILLVVVGFFGFTYLNGNSKIDNQIAEAKELVLYNPLANGEASSEIKNIFEDSKSLDEIRNRAKNSNLEKLIPQAKKEVEKASTKELDKQNKLYIAAQKKFATAKKQANFPKSSLSKEAKITDLYEQFKNKKDVVGVNATVMSLQSLVGDSLSTIQKKTKQQVAKEKEKKDKELRLAKAVKDQTYPSIGMLRGDLPNGNGVFGFYTLPGGPADNGNLPTSENDWGDHMAIVSLDGHPVKSSIIGDGNMEDVLKSIELGKKVKVGFKDGSTKKITLALTHKEAASKEYPELPDPGKDATTDVNFGVSGYNIGEKRKNKEIGLVVTSIYRDGSVYGSKIKVGDIICRIDGYWVGDTQSISRIMSNYSSGVTVDVDYVTTSGHLKTAKIRLKD